MLHIRSDRKLKSRPKRNVEPFSQISWIHFAGFQLTVPDMALQQTLSLFHCHWSNSRSKMMSDLEVCRLYYQWCSLVSVNRSICPLAPVEVRGYV